VRLWYGLEQLVSFLPEVCNGGNYAFLVLNREWAQEFERRLRCGRVVRDSAWLYAWQGLPTVDSHVGNVRALLIQGKQQTVVRPLCDAKLVEGAEPLALPQGFVATLGVARGLRGPPHLHCDIFDGVARAVFPHGHKRVAARSRVLDFVR
jgi:hypothetical protein